MNLLQYESKIWATSIESEIRRFNIKKNDVLITKDSETIDKIVETIGIQIDKLKELRRTLINNIVTGKIKVVE